MPSSSSPLILVCFWFLCLPSSSSNIVTLPAAVLLSASHDPYQLASTSKNRARHLKNSTTTTTLDSSSSYGGRGGYSISLSFGTPPSSSHHLLMDTASALVWIPCTHRYQCNNCTTTPTQPFIPKLSSSSKLIACSNPQCAWIHHDINVRCDDDHQICPPYFVFYASGTTAGLLLSETLNFPSSPPFHQFVLGCSLFSSHQPPGIAGFGRGPASLPNQLALDKFSYCLRDDPTKTTSIIFTSGSNSDHKTNGVSYTPFVENPHAFSAYYYVSLRRIIVGGKRVKVPYKYLWPESNDGSGGTIVDSGTTFTFMTREVFELVAVTFVKQVGDRYERVLEIEAATGLGPCFNITGHKTVSLPDLVFHYKGGAEMKLPLANYFLIPDNSNVACLAIVTDNSVDSDGGGPSIILGNFQMHNYYLEYDLRNERFGFRPQTCS